MINSQHLLVDFEDRRYKLQNLIEKDQKDVNEAELKVKTRNEYADQTWYNEKKTSIRENTVELHRVCRQIKEMKRGETNMSQFQIAAKDLLDEETYNKILNHD